MKKIIVLGSVVFFSGCATTANFFELTPTQTNNQGYWTGAHSNISVATLKLNQDGTGTICQDYQGAAKVQSIKKVANKVYTQDGSFWTIKNESDTNLELVYGAGGSYKLKKDDNGLNITPACKHKLN
ncbi:J517_1871 family lipoprotein [Acinetobacter baumannii]|uniref:J517_1871 family lipoprotein n=1 Tax=Acinetobacter baumannii TaxID=470 RepID=UPI0025A2D8A2|nr:J517_1871 family lipoprotein [Acinetobacter baumannii]